MIGVILWSDDPLTKAVIWCDDQGDLAFYTNKAGADFPELHAGDWVAFDITLSDNLRIAENLSVVMEQGSPGLAERLCSSADPGQETEAGSQKPTVIPFPMQPAKKRRAGAPLQVVQG